MAQFIKNYEKNKKSRKLRRARKFVQFLNSLVGENNQVEVEFSTAIALLKRINITLDEFTERTNIEAEFELPDEIVTAIKDEDVPVLRKYAQDHLAKYHASKNILELKNIMLVCNQLLLNEGRIT